MNTMAASTPATDCAQPFGLSDPLIITLARLLLDDGVRGGAGMGVALLPATLLRATAVGADAGFEASAAPTSGAATGKAVALEVLFPFTVGGPETALTPSALLEEIRAAHEVGLTSDNLVPVVGVCLDFHHRRHSQQPACAGGEVALVTDRMVASVDELIGDRTLPLGMVDAVQLVQDVAVGLAQLHGCGMVHGDLRTPRVQLDKQGRARLSGFGMPRVKAAAARAAAAGSRGAVACASEIAMLAPELLDPDVDPPQQPSPASDMFALGMLLFEVLVREAPWAGLHNPVAQIPLRVLSGKRPGVERLPAAVPSSVVELLQQLWSHEPRARPVARAAVAQLRTALMDLEAEAPRAFLVPLLARSMKIAGEGGAAAPHVSTTLSEPAGVPRAAHDARELTELSHPMTAASRGSFAEDNQEMGSTRSATSFSEYNQERFSDDEQPGRPADAARGTTVDAVSTSSTLAEASSTAAPKPAAAARPPPPIHGKSVIELVRLLPQHARDGTFAKAACAALALGAWDKPKQRALVRAGVVAPAMEVLRHHDDDAQVLAAVYAVLAPVANSSAGRKALTAAGVVDPTLRLLERFHSQATPADNICLFLATACIDGDMAEAFSRAGAVRSLLAVLQVDASRAAVGFACIVLRHVSAVQSRNGAAGTRQGDIVETLLQLLKRSECGGELADNVWAILGNVVDGPACDCFIEGGGIELAVQAFNRHQSRMSVIRQVAPVLKRVLSHDSPTATASSAERMRNCKAVAAVAAVLHRYASDRLTCLDVAGAVAAGVTAHPQLAKLFATPLIVRSMKHVQSDAAIHRAVDVMKCVIHDDVEGAPPSSSAVASAGVAAGAPSGAAVATASRASAGAASGASAGAASGAASGASAAASAAASAGAASGTSAGVASGASAGVASRAWAGTASGAAAAAAGDRAPVGIAAGGIGAPRTSVEAPAAALAPVSIGNLAMEPSSAADARETAVGSEEASPAIHPAAGAAASGSTASPPMPALASSSDQQRPAVGAAAEDAARGKSTATLVRLLGQRADDAAFVVAACERLADGASWPEKRAELMRAGVVASILGALLRQREQPGALVALFSLLAPVSAAEDGQRATVIAGLLELSLRLLQHHRSNAAVATSIMHFLRMMARDATCVAALLRAGAIAIFAAVIQSLSDVPHAIEIICTTTAALLASVPGGVDAASFDDLVDAFVAALRRHVANAQLAAKAWQLIRLILPRHHAHMLSAGVVELAVMALREHGSDSQLALQVGHVVRSLLWEGTDEAAATEKFAAAGGAAALASAIRAHSYRDATLAALCGAVRAAVDGRADVARELSAAGIVELLESRGRAVADAARAMEAIRAASVEPRAAVATAGKLAAHAVPSSSPLPVVLASESGGATSLAGAQAATSARAESTSITNHAGDCASADAPGLALPTVVPDLVVMLRKCHQDAGLVSAACKSLARGAWHSGKRNAMLRAGVTPALVQALQAHTGAPAVVVNALEVLTPVANCLQGNREVAASGLAPTLMVLLRQHAGNAMLVDAVCGFVEIMRQHEGFMNGLWLTGLTQLAVDLLARHGASPRMATSICASLNSPQPEAMSAGDVQASNALADALFALLKRHGTDLGLATAAWQTLQRLRHIEPRKMRSAGIPAAVTTMELHHADVSLAQTMGIILAALLDGVTAAEQAAFSSCHGAAAIIAALRHHAHAKHGGAVRALANCLAVAAKAVPATIPVCASAGVAGILTPYASFPEVQRALAALPAHPRNRSVSESMPAAGVAPHSRLPITTASMASAAGPAAQLASTARAAAAAPPPAAASAAAPSSAQHCSDDTPTGPPQSIVGRSVAELVALLLQHQAETDFVVKVCKSLRDGAWDDKKCKPMLAAGIVPIAVAALAAHAAAPEPLIALFGVLHPIANCDEGRAQLATSGVADMIAPLLWSHHNREDVIYHVAAFLATARLNDLFCRSAFRAGLAACAEALLVLHADAPRKLASCLRILSFPSPVDAESQQALHAERVRIVQRLFAIAHRYAADAAIVSAAWWAIASWHTRDVRFAEWPESAMLPAVTAMTRHEGDTSIVQRVGYALQKLLDGAEPAVLNSFMIAGGVDAIARAARKHSAREAVVHGLSCAIEAAARASPDVRDAFVRAGTQDVLRAHSAVDAVSRALQALHALAATTSSSIAEGGPHKPVSGSVTSTNIAPRRSSASIPSRAPQPQAVAAAASRSGSLHEVRAHAASVARAASQQVPAKLSAGSSASIMRAQPAMAAGSGAGVTPTPPAPGAATVTRARTADSESGGYGAGATVSGTTGSHGHSRQVGQKSESGTKAKECSIQ